MRRIPFLLRVTASLLVGAFFLVTLLVSAHNHAGSGSGEIHACNTCQILPQGVQFVQESPTVHVAAEKFFAEIPTCFDSPLLSLNVSCLAIRGPPSA